MNKQQMTAKHLATFTDRELRVGLKGASEDEAEQKLASITQIFCFLFERDIYIKAYSQLLGNRLLNNTFLSRELEA